MYICTYLYTTNQLVSGKNCVVSVTAAVHTFYVNHIVINQHDEAIYELIDTEWFLFFCILYQGCSVRLPKTQKSNCA